MKLAYDFFANSIVSGASPLPNEMYRELEQAFIDEQWDNTSAMYTLQEQDSFGSSEYHEVEAWMSYVVGTTSSGLKNGQDFIKIAFRDIDHPCFQGRYYIYKNNYWLGDFTNFYDGASKVMTIRRCNNILRIVDPENGSIFSAPCIVDYDMTSPSQQVSRYVITPNNHAIVMVQANDDTMRLFRYNTRYMLNGRPFKLLAFQNALNSVDKVTQPNILYLDLYLDELHAKDDIENQLADNGDYNYQVVINAQDMELVAGATGQLTATVTLNGQEIDRDVQWYSSNTAVTIDEQGNYVVTGSVGSESVITAWLAGNSDTMATINITIATQIDIEPTVIINPEFDKIRQHETISVTAQAFYNGIVYDPDAVTVSLSPNAVTGVTAVMEGNTAILTCNKLVDGDVAMLVEVEHNNPTFVARREMTFKTVSMMG